MHSPDPAESIRLFRRAALQSPGDPRPHAELARLYVQNNQPDRAADAIRRAIEVDPKNPAHHANYGFIHSRLGRHADAVVSFRRALELSPQPQPTLFLNLALSLKSLSLLDDALAACDRAIAIAPDFPEAHEYRGLTLAAIDRHPDAVASFRRSLELRDSPTAWNNLGVSLQKLNDPHAAIDAYRRAVSLHPKYPDALNNLGTALIDAGCVPAEALPHYTAAATLAPDRADIRLNCALAYLAAGDFERGWPEHEHRLRSPKWAFLAHLMQHPMWNGSPAPDKTLLLHAEQGFGDTLQFARFLPLAAGRVHHLVIQCQPGLESLLQSSFPQSTVLPRGHDLPAFDLQLPMLSLPYVLRTTLHTLPTAVPYLTPPSPAQTSDLSPQHLNVGLAFSGSSTDPHRSIPPDLLTPLLAAPNTTFHLLQKDVPNLGSLRLHDLPDFSATASVIQSLDLVISIDTATAHLAGALGKPTWTLLRFAPDWRWSLAKDTTPWYLTMRLFRQPAPNDWRSVIAEVVSALAAMRR